MEGAGGQVEAPPGAREVGIQSEAWASGPKAPIGLRRARREVLQFVIREYKKCNGDGTFATNADDTKIGYSDAVDELECAFGVGQIPNPEFDEDPYRRQWLDWATLYHGRKSDVFVWLHETFPGYKGNGVLPWAGPAVIHLQARDYLSDRKLLAHELGHTLGGLAHADTCVCNQINPRTGLDHTAADYWDLVRHPPAEWQDRCTLGNSLTCSFQSLRYEGEGSDAYLADHAACADHSGFFAQSYDRNIGFRCCLDL